jgi:hypothetical protein
MVSAGEPGCAGGRGRAESARGVDEETSDAMDMDMDTAIDTVTGGRATV